MAGSHDVYIYIYIYIYVYHLYQIPVADNNQYQGKLHAGIYVCIPVYMRHLVSMMIW